MTLQNPNKIALNQELLAMMAGEFDTINVNKSGKEPKYAYFVKYNAKSFMRDQFGNECTVADVFHNGIKREDFIARQIFAPIKSEKSDKVSFKRVGWGLLQKQDGQWVPVVADETFKGLIPKVGPFLGEQPINPTPRVEIK